MAHCPNNHRVRRVLFLGVLSLGVLVIAAAKEKPPLTYPVEGKIFGTGVNTVTMTRTYKVEANNRIYELDCGKRSGLFTITPGECGGDKKLQIGDILHFRIEKGWACIAVPVTVSPTGEQKLRILHEDLKPNAKPAEGSSATLPAKTGTPPADAKQ